MDRYFKLRNGIVVKEWKDSPFHKSSNGGYWDDYKIVFIPNKTTIKRKIGSTLYLKPLEYGFPIGWNYGSDYDIVEELFAYKE